MIIQTQIPIGSKLKVIESGDIVTLEEIKNYPTRFKVSTDSGDIKYYRTHEVEQLKEEENS